ncbi:MAG: class I SAM-dependent methyltransferase [bacterium]|nr:class I SAM-dependent methyltransferase [bacterium]
MTQYPPSFFQNQQAGAKQSAESIIPLIREFIKPTSVVDIGCGTGAWLSVWQKYGVTDILGIDGGYVNQSALFIPSSNFVASDLEKPLTLEKNFDVAMSLEVAEHLSPQSARSFIRSLTTLAPMIIFSAAIPGQGGVSHKNEQWPDYWANIFNQHGYVCIDCLRRRIWLNDKIQWWYAQNILFFTHKDFLNQPANNALRDLWEKDQSAPLPLVHPKLYSSIHPDLVTPNLLRPSHIGKLLLKGVKKLWPF